MRAQRARGHVRTVRVVNQPTRGDRTLDKIISNLHTLYNDVVVSSPIGMSDHCTLLWKPKAPQKRPNLSKYRQNRPMPDSATRSFGRWISSHDWSEVKHENDVNQQCEQFYTTLNEAIDLHFPLRRMKIHSQDRPWMNPEIKSLIRRRQLAYHEGREHEWKELRNKVIRKIKKAKGAYYPDRIQHLKDTNPSSWYREIRFLCGLRQDHPTIDVPGVDKNDSKAIANAINSHFVSISADLQPLDFRSLPAYLPSPAPCPEVHPWEVQKALQKIRRNTAPGPDGISARIVHDFSYELATPLTHIINSSLQKGASPDRWKQAIVVPIPKTKPPTLCKLRPVSLTDHFAKVAEGFVAKWVLSDIEPNLDPNQFGNRKALSTSHYVIKMLHEVIANAEKPKSSSTVVVTDFTKAFDKIDHTTAISNLIVLGVRQALIPWIADFLCSRQQCVRYQSTMSDWSEIHAGVPQGTRLGPVIFLAMINGASAPQGTSVYKYVDDIALVECRSSNQHSSIQEAVSGLSSWSERNKMSLNPPKCATMEISFAKNRPDPPQILLADQYLKSVNSVKLLGIMIQKDLKWDLHITESVKRANQKLYMLRLLKKHCLSSQDLLDIYRSYVLPILEYGAPVWNGALTKQHEESLEKIQKRALRIINGSNYTNYEETLQVCQLKTLRQRREDLCRNFIEKTLKKTDQFKDFFVPPSSKEMNLRHSRKVSELRCKTNRLRNSAIPYLTRLINNT